MAGPRVAILGAARTPIGKFGGSLRSVPVVRLGAIAVEGALSRSHVEASDVPMVLFGQCIQAGTGQNPARQALRASGIPDASGAATINMVCGSGMQALISATQAIRAGDFELVVAGGMESMSSSPFLVPGAARWGIKSGAFETRDAMLTDALLDAYGEHEHMGMTGERIAEKYHLTRSDIDRFALRSHRMAGAARDDGTFAREIVPVPPAGPREVRVERDEGPRPESSLETMAGLRPSFRPDGVLTAGNSSQLSDGAAALVLASEGEVERRKATPLAWVHSAMVSGVSPSDVMEAPIPTVRKHLERSGFSARDFDRVEHNEAFASASLAVQRAFGFPDDRFNVHGGAVALGHPIGASGARIVVTLLNELVHHDLKLGLATLCMGGGNGLSVVVDRRDVRGAPGR